LCGPSWQNGTNAFLGVAPVAVFANIPYALPPVGPLRFEPASQWSLPWSDVRDARHRGAQCPQPDRYSVNSTYWASHWPGKPANNFYEWFGQMLVPEHAEDCLNLEVITPLPLLESIQAVGGSLPTTTCTRHHALVRRANMR
jgi:carboxylesterase type B